MRYHFIIIVSYTIVVESSKLTAVSMNVYGNLLYRMLRTEAPASIEDPAATNAQKRGRICEEVASSGLFSWMNYKFIDKRKLYRKRRKPRYVDIFDQLHTPTKKYMNPYRREVTGIDAIDEDGERYYPTEYVFICPFKNRGTQAVIPFYVTKEYNVGPFGDQPYMPGRFILRSIGEPQHPDEPDYVFMAEEPAMAYPTKNIELIYLDVRQHIAPASSRKDPLCKIVSENLFYPNNQHNRLCVVVIGSESLKSNFGYPSPTFPNGCQEMEVAFRTTKGIRKAAGIVYYELVTRCSSIPRDKKGALYISRGYKSQQVFVYRQDRSDMRIYLDSLHTNVKIVDELNSFDFVEN